MDYQIFITRIGVAFLAGFLIGLEREMKHKKAGLRTNALVAIGAAIFVLISLSMQAADATNSARIIGQVVTGIGFIGAGVIIHREGDILGITTAATIWCSAALGILAAVGMFKELAASTFIVLFVNRGLVVIEDRIKKRSGGISKVDYDDNSDT